jgi:hypothetical protein
VGIYLGFFAGQDDDGGSGGGGGGDGGIEAAETSAAAAESDATVAPSTIGPTPMPSASPMSSCLESITSGYTKLGLGQSPSDFPPSVAMDGDNAVVVTNSGEVRFYTLRDNGEYEEVDYFPNINRSRATPHVAISSNIAVVGFLYQRIGFDQEMGGAYVYERDPSTGRWKRVHIIMPGEDEDIDASARFGWSVDVDANQANPLIVVGAFGEAENRGSVYVYEKGGGEWSQVAKVVPEYCTNGNFGFSVAVENDLIAATTDCEYIVQIHRYDRATKSVETDQNIRFISFELGAIDGLVMNDQNLVYSTVFGNVVLFERNANGRSFDYLEQVDFSGNQELTSYPLAIDEDILVVGVGNQYHVLPKRGDSWNANSFSIENEKAAENGVPSVAVSGRNVLAGAASPKHEAYHYNIQLCTDPQPTQSPTRTNRPTISPRPTPRPTTKSTKKPTDKPTPGSPTVSPTTEAPFVTPFPTGQAPVAPTENPSPPPSASPVVPPSCYFVDIDILFDDSPFGTGYVLTKVNGLAGGETSVDTFFPFDESLASQPYSSSLCLEEGSYKFTMYDSFGDGICCANGEGEYVITSDGVTLAKGGEFTGFSVDETFELPPASV